MKFTMTPAFTSHAMKAINATSNAVPAASAPKRVVSPPAISPSDAPVSNEIAEVTVTTVCRELQNNQKTSPPNRQAYSPASGGKLARDASPKPAGRRYAASVMPAKTSLRNQLRSYARSQPRAGITRVRDGAFIAAVSSAFERPNDRDLFDDAPCILWPRRELLPEDHYAPGARSML